VPERQARGIFAVLENRILRLAALIAAIALILGTGAAAIRWLRDVGKGQEVQSPRAKEATVLGRLAAGVSSERFERGLTAKADVSRPLSGGFVEHLYVRPYEYVQAVADQGGTVVSFLVLATDPKFHPRFGFLAPELTLNGPTSIRRGIDAWGGPNQSAGYCGAHKAGYFERAGGYGFTNSRYLVLGVSDIGTYDPKSGTERIDTGPICNSESLLGKCSEPSDAPIPLADDFVACFTKSADGQKLRAQLRPNLVAVTAPGADFVPQMVEIDEAGIAAARMPSSR
jgi:hypothetical protein